MATQSASTVPPLGEMLRYWRHERGKSQLALSLDTGISQRHLSFVESGRSAPSRDLLTIVSDALNIPLRETECSAACVRLRSALQRADPGCGANGDRDPGGGPDAAAT